MGIIRNRLPKVAGAPPTPSRRALYRIIVLGAGRAVCTGWPDASAVENGDGSTTITATVDQASLRGILCQLWDLNATLIAATWAPDRSEPDRGIGDD